MRKIQPDKATTLALAGIMEAGRKAGAPYLEWSINVHPNHVEFNGVTNPKKIKPEKAADAAKKWAKVVESSGEIDPPHYAGTVYYVSAGDGPIIVTITGVTDPELYAKRIDLDR